MSDRLYKLIAEAADVFTAPTPEELIVRHANSNGWTLQSDGRYNVTGNVTLYESWVKDGKMIPKFKTVFGYFDCNRRHLVSLEGSPEFVATSFYAYNNFLTDLVGGPKEVRATYSVSNNRLASLEGSPRIVGNDFDVSYNPLKSLKGIPREVKGNFIYLRRAGSLGKRFSESDINDVCNVKGKVII